MSCRPRPLPGLTVAMRRLDHLVVVASGLAAGTAWAGARLGVPPSGGGVHSGMGTHNRLWRMGPVYLEVIAPDPNAPDPEVPRWFGLDDPDQRARMALEGPFLATWAVATDDLAAVAADAPVAMRAVEPCSRGAMRWEIARTEGISRPLGGLWPLALRWNAGGHPTDHLPDHGLVLQSLDLAGPDAHTVDAALGPLEGPVRPAFRVEPGPAAISATILRRDGVSVTL